MNLIEIVSVLALAQYLVFGALVGRARGTYGVHAPAVTGHVLFERWYRVQMNTLELLVVLLPALWLAARHWSPTWVAAIGAVYLLGRTLYAVAYVRDPKTRALGFMLSLVPVALLLAAALLGALRGVVLQGVLSA